MRALVLASIAAAAAALVFACSSDPPAQPADPDASFPVREAGPPDPPADAAPDAPDAGARCDGPCAETKIAVTFGAASATLTRAQFGYDAPDDAGVRALHVEAHLGGAPECPTQQSPTPRHTLIVTGTAPTVAPLTTTRASFLDFAGTFSLPPAVSTPNVTGRVASIGSLADGGAALTMELTATFDGGTATGTIAADHCDSLDTP